MTLVAPISRALFMTDYTLLPRQWEYSFINIYSIHDIN